MLAAFRAGPACESVEDAAPFCVPLMRPPPLLEGMDSFVPPCGVHISLSSAVGEAPADASAARQDDPDGFPPAPLASDPLAEKASETEDGSVPQFVLTLASVGTPGDASAVEHVDA